MSTQLDLRLLGKPQIIYGSQAITAELVSAKGQALLIYLVVSARRHSRSALAGLLWGDLPEESARANLRLALTKLRKVIPAYVETSRLEVAFAAHQPHQADVVAFTRLLQGNPAGQELAAATALYRGSFLEDFIVPNAPDFDLWVMAQREKLHQLASGALLKRLKLAEQERLLADALAAARQLLHIEPWHEEGHRAVMRLLAASGQRHAALAQYETCCRLLAEELGVEPAAETAALYEEILHERVARWPTEAAASQQAGSPPPHNLPMLFTPFVGRAAELERLSTRLRDGRYRLVTLLGEGGAGKTRLALAAAEQVLPFFGDGVWFVPLAGLETAVSEPPADSENGVAVAIAAALGLNFAPGDPPKQQLANYLRQRQALIILDNFEPLLDAAGLVLTLLSLAPKVTVLVTSRAPLRLQAELLFRVDGLTLPESDDWETAVAADSIQLFAERAERARGRSLLTPANLPIVAQLCRFVNGLPLAIELVADWTRWLSLDAIAADLQTNLWQVDTGLKEIPERHRSLHAVFSYSWQMLTLAEQQTLAQLSVFRGGFQLDAVRAVAHSSPATLFALIDKSLVQHQAGDYYTLHELLRAFAQAQLATISNDRQALYDRHAAYYLARAGERAAALLGPTPAQALLETQAEAENLAQAWQWACARPLPGELLAAVSGISTYWNYAGLFLEADLALRRAIDRLEPLVGAAPEAYNGLLAALSGEHAVILYELTRLEEMKAAAEAAIIWSQQAGDKALEANGRLRLGQFYWRKGSHAAAASELERAVQMAQELDLPNLEGIAYRSLAANAWRQGDIAGAQRHGERSAVLHRQTNDVRNLFRSHYFLAIVAQNQQQLATARAYLEPIWQAAPELGDRPLETGAVSLLAQIASYEGQYEQALAYLKRERQLAEESGRQWQLGSNLSNLGDVWLRLGNFAEAEACYTTALALFRQLETRQAQSNVLAYMGLAACLQGDYRNGRTRCEEALHLARQEKALREEAFALTFLGHNLCGQQEWLAACASYEAAMVVWQQLNDASRQMEAQAGLARARLENGEQAAAAATIAPVLAFLKGHTLDGANDPAQVYLNCIAVLTAVNDQQADAVLRRGQALLAKRAGQIADPHLRQQFLTAIPSHQALLAYAD